MQVSGIGGAALGGAGLGGAGSIGGTGTTGATSNVPTSAPVVTPEMPAPGGGTILAGSIAASANALGELMQGYDLAQLLFALIVMQAMNENDDDSGGGGLGFLAGFALASSLGQSNGNSLDGNGAPSIDGATGGNLDVTA